MHSIREELRRRKEEAAILIDLIIDMEEQSGQIDCSATLKSTCIMILYNAVESTMYLILNKVHDYLSLKKYKDLTEPQKKIYAKMHFKISSSDLHLSLNALLEDRLKFPSLNEFRKKDKLFSGDLDARKIRDLLCRYSIPFCIPNETAPSFLVVKNLRNKLGHGDESFSIASRNYTRQEIKKIYDDIFNALGLLINAVERWLEN